MTTKTYKTYDYQIGAGFQYQWWIATFLFLCVTQDIHLKSKHFKDIFDQLALHTNFLGKPLSETKIFLEGDLKCFDDINIFSNGENIDNFVFLQVKGQKESSDKVLLQNNKIIHAIENYINNCNNLVDENNSRLIIVTSKQVSILMKKMISGNGGDIKIRETKMISFLRKKYPKCTLEQGLRVIDVLFRGKDYKVNPEMLEYTKRINLSLKNVKLIESVNREMLENELRAIIGDCEALIIKDKIEKLSVDITPIASTDKEFEIYKDYPYTQFKFGKRISDLQTIDSPKIIN